MGRHYYVQYVCQQCGVSYMGRKDGPGKYCSLRCSGLASNPRQTEASQVGYLRCTKCGQEKPEDDFGLWKRSPTGRKSRCKECRAEDFQASKTPEVLARMSENGRRWYQENQERVAENSRRWHERNPEKSAENTRRWRQRHPDRVREMNLDQNARRRLATAIRIPDELLRQKLVYWGEKCWVCGGQFEQWDHFKPLAKGGPHLLANLRPICGKCNRSKQAKWPYQPPCSPVLREAV